MRENPNLARMGESKTVVVVQDERRCPEHGGRVQQNLQGYTRAMEGEYYRCCGKRVPS